MAERGIVVLTQDWHSADHGSFASVRGGRSFEEVSAPCGMQTLWPDHCVQRTRGAEFHACLDSGRARMVVRKGMDTGMDSYSAFFENDRATATGLCGFLRDLGAQSVEIVGLATDFCVKWTALDAKLLGFDPPIWVLPSTRWQVPSR